MKNSIPPTIKRLFWDLDSSLLEIQLHKKTIIERVLNTGSLSDWRWLRNHYSTEEVQQVLALDVPYGRVSVRPESRLLASLILV